MKPYFQAMLHFGCYKFLYFNNLLVREWCYWTNIIIILYYIRFKLYYIILLDP